MSALIEFTRRETAFALEIYSRSQSMSGVMFAIASRLALRASCKAGLPAPFKGACD